MSQQNIRIMKEARSLLWPWVAVMLVAALSRPLASALRVNTMLADGAIACLYLAAPLLAALPFGNEFQHRTMSVLLAQPVSRLEIWREKWIVMLVAVTSVSLVYLLTWRVDFEQDIIRWLFGAAFIVATLGSSTFWTLIARSTIGGLILNCAVQATIVGTWTALAQSAFARRHLSSDAFPFLVSGFVFTLFYSAVMLWIGRLKLVRFQVTGEIAGQDLLSGSRLMPESVAQWWRWQPSGATLNLIKKELRLLRPVWLLALLMIAFFLCLAPLRFFANPSVDTYVSEAGVIGVGMYFLLGGILAGSLSMGEERQLGTHSWHLTLPVSVGGQWLIKLLTSLSLSLASGFLVFRSAGLFLGPAFQKAFHGIVSGGDGELSFLAVYLFILTLTAFCCACAVNGTVRAAAWTVPALMILGTAGWLGTLVAGLARELHLIQPIVLAVHAFPTGPPNDRRWAYVLLSGLLVSAAFAAFQSLRLFRTERPQSMKAAVRPLLLVWVVVYGYVLLFGLIRDVDLEIFREQRVITREVGTAVSKLELDPGTVDSAHPRAVSVADLRRVYPLSNVTETWLKNASISVVPPPKPLEGHPVLRFFRNGKWEAPNANLSAKIRFSNGWECQAYDEIGNCRPSGGVHPPLWPFFN
jgi:hypothetical protein